MNITLNLSDDAKRIFLETGSFTGSCEVSITNAPTTSRKEAMLNEQIDRQRKKMVNEHILSHEEKMLLNAWNQSEFITTTATKESRNNPVTLSQYSTNLRIVRKAIKDVGLDKILSAMERYFACCLEEKHLWDGKNHGYSHLIGFLRKLVDFQRTKVRPFWMEEIKPIEDDHPDQTLMLADTFAKRILNRPKYGLKNPSPDYLKFYKAAEWFTRTMELQPWGLTETELAEHLCDALEKVYGGSGRIVQPGHLSSDNFWKVVLPQHLQDRFS